MTWNGEKEGDLRKWRKEGSSVSGRHSAVRSYLCLTDQRGRGGACIRASNSSAQAKQGRKAKASENVAVPSTLIQLRRRYIVCQVEVRVAHVVESSPGQQSERESTVVRLGLRLHCLGKAGSLGEGGIVDLAAAAAGEETQIVKDLGLVTILLLAVTDEKSPEIFKTAVC